MSRYLNDEHDDDLMPVDGIAIKENRLDIRYYREISEVTPWNIRSSVQVASTQFRSNPETLKLPIRWIMKTASGNFSQLIAGNAGRGSIWRG
jgi:hypothetical protein